MGMALLLPLAVTTTVATATPAGATGAAITRSPAIGPVGTLVTMSGTGFGAKETVSLRFDTIERATTTTGGTGAFSAKTFRIPYGQTLGVHTVSATGLTSGLSASLPFTVAAKEAILQGASCSGSFYCFSPATRTMHKGNYVQWINTTGAAHNVTRCTVAACGVDGGTGTQSGLGSSTIASGGGIYRFKFNQTGTYIYYCTIHGYAAMHGTITVIT